MKMTMNRSTHVLQALILLKGNSSTNFFLLRSKNPFSSFTQLGFDFSHPHNSLSASFHSKSSLISRSSPRSKFKKVTKLDGALKLFDRLKQTRPLPSVFEFTQLLNVVTKLKHFSASLDIFKQMCSLGVPVNNYSMCIAIKCCCQLYQTNDAFAVLGYCFRRKVVPDLFIFSTILDGLVLENRIPEAERLFKKLIEKKLCEPDVVTYNSMIKGLCKFGNNITAIQLLRLMDERGCRPDAFTYSTIIDSLCKDKMIDDAFKLFKEMVFHKGILPNDITYNSMICGLCNLGKIEEAEAVIDGHCLRGEMTKARTVFDLITSKGLVPNVVTYNSLLNGYCKNWNVEEAIHMLREMKRKGLKPNVVTYNTMIQGLFEVGHEDESKLFDEMRVHGQVPDECTYRIILEGLCNNHQVEDALALFNLMANSKLNSDIVVYNILIDGACKCGKLKIAKDLFCDLTNKGLLPDVRAYTVMISGLCREGLVSEAKKLFLKMKASLQFLPIALTMRYTTLGVEPIKRGRFWHLVTFLGGSIWKQGTDQNKTEHISNLTTSLCTALLLLRLKNENEYRETAHRSGLSSSNRISFKP